MNWCSFDNDSLPIKALETRQTVVKVLRKVKYLSILNVKMWTKWKMYVTIYYREKRWITSFTKVKKCILTNTNNAPPKVGAVEFLYAVLRNSFTCHLILLLISNNNKGQIDITNFR